MYQGTMIQHRVGIGLVLFEFEATQNFAKKPLIWPLTHDLWPFDPQLLLVFVKMLLPTHLYNLQRYQVFPSKDTAVPKNLFIWPLTCDLWPLYPKSLEAKVLDQGYPSTKFGSCMYYSFWVISDTKSIVAYAHTHTHPCGSRYNHRGPYSSQTLDLYYTYRGLRQNPY